MGLEMARLYCKLEMGRGELQRCTWGAAHLPACKVGTSQWNPARVQVFSVPIQCTSWAEGAKLELANQPAAHEIEQY